MCSLTVSMHHASGDQLTHGEYRSIELNSSWISSNVFKDDDYFFMFTKRIPFYHLNDFFLMSEKLS